MLALLQNGHCYLPSPFFSSVSSQEIAKDLAVPFWAPGASRHLACRRVSEQEGIR